jgi:hypothetical protein
MGLLWLSSTGRASTGGTRLVSRHRNNRDDGDDGRDQREHAWGPSYVAGTQMHGAATFFDVRLNEKDQYPVSAKKWPRKRA